jgi:hypothetical protein
MVVAPGARERERRVRETAFVNNEYANAGQDAAIPSAAARQTREARVPTRSVPARSIVA